MAMKINSLSYTFKEALKNLWRNRMMSFASISSVSATLLILGIIIVLIVNINSITSVASDQFQVVQVFMEDGVTSEQMNSMTEFISSLDGVKDIKYESKEDALEMMKEQWQEYGYLLDGLEENPLPNSLTIALDELLYADYVVDQVGKLENIEDIKYYQDTVQKIITITSFVKNAGLAIIFVLIFISTFIIHNTIKLAVNARRKEIGIMKYVGATNWFVKWPFLVEGTILGIIGALISTGMMYLIYKYTLNVLNTEFYVIIAAYLVPLMTVIKDLLSIFLVVGAGIGALGSIWSMKRYLEV